MAQFDIFDIVGDCIEAFCLFHHLVGRHKEELGVLVDKLFDQPRTSYAVDLDVFSRDLFHFVSPFT
jgi:hypothetical protein